MSPQSLNVVGSTQPEVFRLTVEEMAQAVMADPAFFWINTVQSDGPIEIWVINGERFLFNGNHRYQAALAAGADIPPDVIDVKDKTGSSILTFRFDQMVWLPGRK
jgi:hypothetical protein